MNAIPQPPSRGFSQKEFQTRCKAIQRNMAESKIDLLWLTGEADIRYVTGFFSQFWQSPTRPWNVLVPLQGEPHAVIPSIGEYCMQQTWINHIYTWSSPNPDDDGVSLLAETIKQLAGRHATVGLAKGPESCLRYPLNDFHSLQQMLPDVQWLDATDEVRSVRHIKSVAEIDKLRHICQITSTVFSKVPEFVNEGVTEIDVFRNFRLCCLSEGADEAKYLVGAARFNGYEDVISPPSCKSLAHGDILMLDTGCVYDGYYSDFDRNFAIGAVDNKTASAHQRVWDATEAGLALVKPGVSFADIFHVMQRELQNPDHEISDSGVGRLGHGLGSELTETPSIAPFEHTPLQSGMVITLEPGYNYTDSKIMVHEENLVVTDNGYELLSIRAPRDIPII